MERQLIRKKRIGVLMGGKSSERDVSLRSGNAIYKALRTSGYKAVPIDAGDDLCQLLKRQKIEIAFLALHGGCGENGAVQGLLEVMEIPYTGSGVLASALAMDKEASKKIFVHHGIPVPPFTIIHNSDLKGPKTRAGGRGGEFRTGFQMPWVVKPATEGSSVGVEIVKNKDAFPKAAKKAFSYGERVIIEKYVRGKEVQIGILNGKVLGGVEVKPSLEFYNYEAKYTAGLTEYIFPPRITAEVRERAEKAALDAHTALGCSGATRVDLIITKAGDPYVLEVNTIPGMTETSLLPKIASQAGLDFASLLDEILKGISD